MQAVESLEKEISVLQKITHNRIIQYYGTERTESSVRIFMEYMPGVSDAAPYVYICMYVHAYMLFLFIASLLHAMISSTVIK